MQAYIRFADNFSAWVGKVFAWCILVMTFGVGYEVFVRYVLRDPTAWAFDLSYMMYGTLFMMAGAYTLSRDGHVRGDLLYRLWRPRDAGHSRVRALLPVLLSRHPGADLCRLAICMARSWRYHEVSVDEPGQYPDLPVQDDDLARRHPAADPGHRPGVPLHDLHAHQAVAASREMSRNGNQLLQRAGLHALDDDDGDRRRRAAARGQPMTDPQVAMLMLGLFIFIIMLGFPIAFTLMAMGVGFGYYAYFDAAWRGCTHSASVDNRIFDLFVNQTYSVMANDVLTAVPLFLFMGYIVERANIVDRLFHTLYDRVAPPAGLDGGRGADHLRDVCHRHRHRRRGGHADGPAGAAGDAARHATTPASPAASSAPAARSASSFRHRSC